MLAVDVCTKCKLEVDLQEMTVRNIIKSEKGTRVGRVDGRNYIVQCSGGLCNTMDEYRNLDLKYIESQAYGSWMDGAR